MSCRILGAKDDRADIKPRKSENKICSAKNQTVMSAVEKKKSPSTLIAGIIILSVGIGLIGMNVYNLYRGAGTNSWPSVTGVVQSSKVQRIHRAGKPDLYRANIRYNFEVEGKSYTSERVKFGERFGTSMEADPVVAKYPRGSEVKVYYNPDDHEDAVLEATMSANIFALFFGPLILIFGLYLLRTGFKQIRNVS